MLTPTNAPPKQLTDLTGLPKRDWELLITEYNKTARRPFPFTPVQCASFVLHAAQGTPSKSVFKYYGVSAVRYNTILANVQDMEERRDLLLAKDELTDEERTELYVLTNNPLRVLINDIMCAEGAAEIHDWERFNQLADNATDLQAMRMKAKYKDVFQDKTPENTGYSVNIQLGGDFMDKI